MQADPIVTPSICWCNILLSLKYDILALKESYFLINNILYKQIDGVAMESPLGLSLANAFLAHYEQTCLDICALEYRTLHYRRYVDDIFFQII